MNEKKKNRDDSQLKPDFNVDNRFTKNVNNRHSTVRKASKVIDINKYKLSEKEMQKAHLNFIRKFMKPFDEA